MATKYKTTISKLLREKLANLSLVEAINLNLSKQLRKGQLKRDVTPILDEIFGKNIYRLYYDLESGKQIYPTKKDPKLKFDVPIIDALKSDIEKIINKLGYSLIDIEKNIAKNNKNNQQIKISKILVDTDKLVAKQYNEYLDSLTKKYKGNDKLCVVLSRHSHDIGSMASKPRISSCEDLSDFTDINQTAIGDEDTGEGYGVGIWEAIRVGKLVFYLIKEGDWNIQDPISRVVGTTRCEFGNSHHFYGEFNDTFKNFVSEWMSRYSNKIKGHYNTRTDDKLYSKSVEEFERILHDMSDSQSEVDNIVRGLIKHERYDVIYDMMCKSEFKEIDNHFKEFRVLDKEQIPRVIDRLTNLFGYKFFNILPSQIKEPIFDEINRDLKQQLSEHETLYEILYLDFYETSDAKHFKTHPELKRIIKKNDLIREWGNISTMVRYGDLAKLANIDLYNKINQYILKNQKVPNIQTKIKDYYDKLFSL